MKISQRTLPTLRLATVAAFMAFCFLFFGWLWVHMGGQIKGVTTDGYFVGASVPDADNLVYDSDVMIAGVRVGKVRDLKLEDGRASFRMQLEREVAPLHEGATVRVRAKTLIQETYLEIVDGKGESIPDGAELPESAAQSSVQIDEVLRTLDAETRASLRATLRSIGQSTKGRRAEINSAMAGLGDLGREGHDAVDALAAQSEDLKELASHSAILLRALDNRRGQIAGLVSDARSLSQATASGQQDVAATLRALPGLLGSARTASGSLTELGAALGPVATNLEAAAPDLTGALRALPAVTRDLHALLPSLDNVLDRAPTTLRRTPTLAQDTSTLVPPLRVDLADLNPMLGYLKPYGRDLAAYFSNVTAQFAQRDVNGHYARVFMIFNEQSLRNFPIKTNLGVLDKSNAYPSPGQATDPGAYQDRYPRLEQDTP